MVSILCHTFQHAAVLEQAMNGFLAQRTRFSVEIVLHDDASTDGTRALIEEYARAHPTLIRPILQDENQFSRGRRPLEFTLPAARGRYIALCEGDDYWTDPEKLQRQVEALEARPDCVLAGHDYVRVEDGVIENRHVHPASSRRDQSADNLLRAEFYFHTATMLFRRPPEPVPSELTRVRNGDRLLTSWLGRYGGAVYVEGISPTVYRRHSGGTWASQDRRQQASHHITTWFWIASYHDRIGNPEIAAHFYGQIMLECLKWSDRLDRRQIRRALRSAIDTWIRSKPALLGPAKAAVRLLRR